MKERLNYFKMPLAVGVLFISLPTYATKDRIDLDDTFLMKYLTKTKGTRK